MEPFDTSDCLREVAAWAGLTVSAPPTWKWSFVSHCYALYFCSIVI